MNRSVLFDCVVVAALVGRCDSHAMAGTVVVPNSFATAEGENGLTSIFRSGAARTYQMQIAASQMSTIPVGAAIHAVAFRLSRTTSSAPFGMEIPDWNLTLAQGAHPVSDASAEFAQNVLNPVLVRSGPMLFANGIYPAGGVPRAFGPPVSFSTPYHYSGGDLIVHLTHSGGTGFFQPTFLDATSRNSAGYGTLFAASNADSFNATTANFMLHEAFVVTQLTFSDVPEPTAAILCGAAILGFGRLRRPRQPRASHSSSSISD